MLHLDTKGYINIRSAAGTEMCLVQLQLPPVSTPPHANEAESIPLTGHVRGAPITGGTVDSRKQAKPPPVVLPPPLFLYLK